MTRPLASFASAAFYYYEEDGSGSNSRCDVGVAQEANICCFHERLNVILVNFATNLPLARRVMSALPSGGLGMANAGGQWQGDSMERSVFEYRIR